MRTFLAALALSITALASSGATRQASAAQTPVYVVQDGDSVCGAALSRCLQNSDCCSNLCLHPMGGRLGVCH